MGSTRLFAYFRQRYEGRVELDDQGEFYSVPDPRGGYKVERLHLALSTDGRHYTPVNEGEPIWDRWLRDPFVDRAPDGVWHLVATTRGQRRSILHATSADLIHWDGDDVLIAEGIRDEGGRPLNNAWAPEWVWDGEQFFVFWSSSFERDGWDGSRLYYCRTRDWRTFSAPEPLFAPPYSVIDGSLVSADGRWWLFHKEEEFGPATGERRAIRLAVADTVDGPYEIVGGPIAPVITEGPAVTADPLEPGWLLSYDFCMADGYGLARSADLATWTPVDGGFPEGARHGSVALLTPGDDALVARLIELRAPATAGSEDVDGGRPPA